LNNTSSGVAPLTYSWNFGGATNIGMTSNQPDPEPTYTTAGTYLITLTVTDCLGLTSSVSETVTVPGM